MNIILFGGSGFVGTSLIRRWANSRASDLFYICDLVSPKGTLPVNCRYLECDVRQPISLVQLPKQIDLIINLAAIHKEPGHEEAEYYQTNLQGARHITALAVQIDCKQIVFTSSIAVYGLATTGCTEDDLTEPVSAYGGSKLIAESIHKEWLERSSAHRLIIVRPGVIFGPGETGNILRMYKAIKAGIFFIPGDPKVVKSYVYIEDVINAIEFLVERTERLNICNLSDPQPFNLEQLVNEIRTVQGKPITSPKHMPASILVGLSRLVQILSLGRSSIHPVRVRKAMRPTFVRPASLSRLGFKFQYPISKAFEDWNKRAPAEL